jgi:S-DNA-T family DNA segregation ATPase FtsK/SpoIIIE
MATNKKTPKKTTNNRKKQQKSNKKGIQNKTSNHLALGITLIIFGFFSIYAYINFSSGFMGDILRQSISYCFGTATLFILFYIIVLGIMLTLNKIQGWVNTFILIFLLFVNMMIMFSLYAPNLMDYSIPELFSLAKYGQYGGIIGILLAVLFTHLFATTGTVLLVFLSSAIIIIFIFRNSIKKYLQYLKTKLDYLNDDRDTNNAPLIERIFKNQIEKFQDKQKIKKEVKATKERTSETTMIPVVGEYDDNFQLFEPYTINEQPNQQLFEPVATLAKPKKNKTKGDPFGFIDEDADVFPPTRENDVSRPDHSKEHPNMIQTDFDELNLAAEPDLYNFPSLDLLNPPAAKKKSKKEDVIKKAKIIEDTLDNFGVKAKIIEVNVGPSITRFELQLDPGVKVNKFVNLSNDLALSLATSDIRIEAPIPGKAAVGIEVPNDISEVVGIREIIDTPQFSKSKSPLTFALGKTLSGENVIGDIGKMPHVLIAGATGSGKSVCINSIIVSLLYKSSPEQLRFIMIDPKMVELNQYNAIPHLLIPVVTDPKKASYALNWGLKEMTDRYMLFKNAGVRDIEGYNELVSKSGEKKLPRIVIVIDELADLMITSPKECENAICRIAQLARACGIHLIIATQRPSVDVITGLIKANIPSRIAFSVASNTDSRTILDIGGAEKLLGKGDMLYFPVGQSKPTRVQCTYVSDSEINAIIDAIRPRKGLQYDQSIEEAISYEPEEKTENKEGDILLEDAINLAFEYNQLSTSMLQRKLQVGYARAGRIIDDLEERGIISGPNGSKPRQILITEDEYKKRVQ